MTELFSGTQQISEALVLLSRTSPDSSDARAAHEAVCALLLGGGLGSQSPVGKVIARRAFARGLGVEGQTAIYDKVVDALTREESVRSANPSKWRQWLVAVVANAHTDWRRTVEADKRGGLGDIRDSDQLTKAKDEQAAIANYERIRREQRTRGAHGVPRVTAGDPLQALLEEQGRMERQARHTTLREALATIPHPYNRVLVLKLAGATLEDIAKDFGWVKNAKDGTVSGFSTTRARNVLRKAVEILGDEIRLRGLGGTTD